MLCSGIEIHCFLFAVRNYFARAWLWASVTPHQNIKPSLLRRWVDERVCGGVATMQSAYFVFRGREGPAGQGSPPFGVGVHLRRASCLEQLHALDTMLKLKGHFVTPVTVLRPRALKYVPGHNANE